MSPASPERPQEPPADPRAGWELPPFGELPERERVDGQTTRLLAPNSSPMTLDGTNTYLLDDGDGAAVIVDPGPTDPSHLERARAALADRDAEAAYVLVTHRHVDHAAAAPDWGRALGAKVLAPDPTVAGPDGGRLEDDQVVTAGGVALEVVATPGHTDDHVCLRSRATGALLTGDHILGRGTSMVGHPDGDLAAYLDSLRRVHRLGPDRLLPGHGPTLDRDPGAVIAFYLAHRDFRQRQILEALGDGARSPRSLVATIYADVDPALWPAAESSTRAALRKLADEGRIRYDGREAALV